MKKWMILSFLMIFIFQGIGAQDVPTSFRANATGEAITDNLDLVTDPIELNFVDSVLLFTNLSNLISSYERILDDDSDDKLLLGIAGEVPGGLGIKSSVLFQYQNDKDARFIGIDQDMDGFNDVTGSGELTDIYNVYEDYTGDGLYDVFGQLEQSQLAYRTNRTYQWLVTGSMDLDPMVIGLSVNYGKSFYEDTQSELSTGGGILPIMDVDYGDNSFSTYGYATDLSTGQKAVEAGMDGDFTNQEEESYMDVMLSGMTPMASPFGTLETRVDLYYSQYTDKADYQNAFIGYLNTYQPDPAMLALLGGSGTMPYPIMLPTMDSIQVQGDIVSNMQEETKLTTMGLGLDVKRVFAPATERRDDGYWRLRASYRRGSGDYTFAFQDSEGMYAYLPNMMSGPIGPYPVLIKSAAIWDSTYMEIDSDMVEQGKETGDVTSSEFLVSGKLQLPLGSRVLLGIGCQWYRSSEKYETNYAYSYESTEMSDVVGDTTGMYYMKDMGKESYKSDVTYEIVENRVTIPVGFEYAMTRDKRWRLRMGANFQFTQWVINDADQITDYKPMQYLYEDAEGPQEVDFDEAEYSSYSEQEDEIWTSTSYTYGLGYYPTPHLQIDVIGFFGWRDYSLLDAEFYRALRLSVTFRIPQK